MTRHAPQAPTKLSEAKGKDRRAADRCCHPNGRVDSGVKCHSSAAMHEGRSGLLDFRIGHSYYTEANASNCTGHFQEDHLLFSLSLTCLNISASSELTFHLPAPKMSVMSQCNSSQVTMPKGLGYI